MAITAREQRQRRLANREDILHLDATKPFGLPDNSFDFVFSEHMIEHISYIDAMSMLREWPKGGQRSLREISAELAQRGIMNERGNQFSAASIASMLEGR
jgi:methyltransferase family protein